MRTLRRRVCLFLAVLACCTSGTAATMRLDVVAATGTTFDGKPIDSITSGTPGMDLNNAGILSFSASYDAGSGPFSGTGVFTSDGFVAGTGSLIAGRTLTAATTPSLNDAGEIVFNGEFAAGGGIFTPTALLAEVGDVIGGRTLTGVFEPAINNHGDVVFRGRVGATARSIFTPTGGVVVLPTSIGGVSLGQISGPAQLSDTGDVAFRADSFSSGFGIYTQDRLVLLNGGVVGDETIQGGFLNPGISPTGAVAFRAPFTGGAIGIVVESTIVAKTGDTIDGRVLTDIGFGTNPPAINSAGEVAFVGSSATGQSIFTQHRLIVEQGDALLGSTIQSVSTPVINDAGQVAFIAGLENGVDALVIARSVPEPSSVTAMCVIALAVVPISRRRSRS